MRSIVNFMKKLNFIALAIIGLYACLNFSSCKKDDDKEPSDVLSGTTWKINSATEDEDFVGATVTFKSDGNVTFSIPDAWSYAKWTYSNDKLKIVLGEGMPDDYMEGSFIINGKNATYNYSWYDVDGKWGGEDHYVMTLTKQ